MAQSDPPIRTYKWGFYASDRDEYTRPPNEGQPIVDRPNLLSFVPAVPNCVGGNTARRSGFDTLSGGSNQADPTSALIGILSSPANGQHWGCTDVKGGNGLSAWGVEWDLPDGQTLANKSQGVAGEYATVAAAGVTNGTTRVIILSTPNTDGSATPAHGHFRNTTIITSISAAINLAVLFRNGSTATYHISADAAMKNSSGHSTAAFYRHHCGVSAVHGEYGVDTNVGPNIRRLVQLGYR